MSFGIFLVAVAIAASSGALFKPGPWYQTIAKPAWTPPDWVFPAGWSLLYLLIAIAGWRIWERANGGAAVVPIAVYAVQLILNAGWSAIFFGLKRPSWAFVWLVLLWLAIVANILVFFPIDAPAAGLLTPYLTWVTFAGALNFQVWRLNRSRA